MATNVFNFVVNQGEDVEIQIYIKDKNKQKIDITDYLYRGQIREKVDATTVIASFTCVIADQRTDKGLVYARLSNQTTSGMKLAKASTTNRRPLTDFIYDIEQVDPSGVITRTLEGVITVSPEVTKL